MRNFFISYNKADRAWAEWIAWELEEEGYTTILQAWDFRPSENFVIRMNQAIGESERTIAVLSPNYINAVFTQPEWAAAFAQDPANEKGVLLPVRVQECDLKGLFNQIIYIDLVGKNKEEAEKALLDGIQTGRVKPFTKPEFPGEMPRSVTVHPAFPGETYLRKFPLKLLVALAAFLVVTVAMITVARWIWDGATLGGEGNTNVNSNNSNGQANNDIRTDNTVISNSRTNSNVITSETHKLIQVVRIRTKDVMVLGFFTSKGYIITYGGGVFGKQSDEITISWSEGRQNYNEVAQVVRIDDKNVALLKLRDRDLSPYYFPIRLSVSLQKGEVVERLIGPEDRTPGKVLEVDASSVFGVSPVLVTTRIAYGGDAGAPVIDSQGKIVAMILGIRGPTETESIPIEEIKISFPEAF